MGEKYEITIAGECSLVMVSPEMVGSLVQMVRESDKRELRIPAEVILPQGYAEYLLCVLEANLFQNFSEARQEISVMFLTGREEGPDAGLQAVYRRVAGQIEMLRVNQQECFEHVDLLAYPCGTQFYLNVSETFYRLAKQRLLFTYVYE